MDRKSKLDQLSKQRQQAYEEKHGTTNQQEITEEDDFIIDDSNAYGNDMKKPTKRGKRNEYYEEEEEYYRMASLKEEAKARKRTFKQFRDEPETSKPVKVDKEVALRSKEVMDDIFKQLDEVDDESLRDEMKHLELQERQHYVEMNRFKNTEVYNEPVHQVRDSGKMVEEKIIHEQSEEIGGIDLAELDALTEEFHRTEQKKKKVENQPVIFSAPKVDLSVRKYHSSMKISNMNYYFNKILQKNGIEFNNRGNMMIEKSKTSPTKIQIIDDDGDETWVTPFYWLDIVPNTSGRNVISFIGKIQDENTKEFKSACLNVKTNYRYIYFCKKKDAKLEDFENEVRQIIKGFLNSTFTQKGDPELVKFNHVRKRYAFELDIDVDEELYADCLEVKIPFRINMPENFLKYRVGEDGNQIYDKSGFRHEGEYFRGIIGVTHTATELAQIHLKLMGPSWFAIQEPEILDEKKKTSWCDVELEISELDEIIKLKKENRPDIPKVKTLYISFIKTDTDDIQNEEIESICLVEHETDIEVCEENPKVTPHFLAINPFISANPSEQSEIRSKMKDKFGPNYNFYPTEFTLLKKFLDKLHSINPDIIIGHEIDSKLEVLFEKISKNIRHSKNLTEFKKFSSFSRFIKEPKPFSKLSNKLKSYFINSITKGRLILDSYKAANEHLKEVDYSLEYISKKHFNYEFTKILKNDNLDTLQTHSKKIDICFQECYFSLLLVKKIQAIQLTKQLTNIAGCLWKQSLSNQRAKRNEMLLMHNFYKQDYLLPDDIKLQHTQKSKKKYESEVPKYKGGKVFAPLKGIHHAFTVLLDFNSLYPSIIRQYKLCFTTVKRTKYNLDFYINPFQRIKYETQMKPPKTLADEHNPDAVGSEKYLNLLPKVVATLIERRKMVKKDMKRERDPAKRSTYDIKQTAFKLIANSIYGCLGFSSSRFFSKDIASMITFYGRSLIQQSAEKVKELGYDVIYGDTDSVMINSRQNELVSALKVALDMKREINSLFKKRGQKSILEVDIDGIFKSFLIHSKKKYAAMMLDNFDFIVNNVPKLSSGEVTPNYKLEIKGLDFVRRDWCNLTKKTGTDLLKIMLNKTDLDDIKSDVYHYLDTLGNRLREGKINIREFTIYKVLSKDPAKYKNILSQPHVAVADRLIKSKKRKLEQLMNHSIGYIICKAEGVAALGERAFHIEEVEERNLSPDYQYYADTQICNPINRIIQYLEGINLERVSQSIGVSASKFKQSTGYMSNDDHVEKNMSFFKSRLPQNYSLITCECPCYVKDKKRYCQEKMFYNPKKAFTCTSLKTHTHDYTLNTNEIMSVMLRNFKQRVKEYYKLEQGCTECSEILSDPLSMTHECQDCENKEFNFKYSSYEVNADIRSFFDILEELRNSKVNGEINKDVLPVIIKFLYDFAVGRSKFNTLDLKEIEGVISGLRVNKNNSRMKKTYNVISVLLRSKVSF